MSLPRLDTADNGFYYVYWTEGRRSLRKSLGTKSQADATKRFAQWLLLDGAGLTEDVEYTITDLWTVYRAKHEVASPETLDFAWLNLGPFFGPLTVPQVTQAKVDAYTDGRLTGRIGREGRKVQSPTVRRELTALLACMNFAAKQKLVKRDVIEELTLPEAGEPRDRWLKMEEVQRLLTAAGEMRFRTKAQIDAGLPGRLSRGERFLWLALETAARKEAIMDLTWDRVDFETLTIHLDVPGRKRTKKGRANVAISGALLPVLKRAYEERINDLVLDNKGAIWATIQHIAIRAGFSDQVVGHSEKPKATGISPHVLRHTAATHMARRGVPLWKIAKVLGNTVAVVEKVYAKWEPDDAAGTVDLISGGLLESAE